MASELLVRPITPADHAQVSFLVNNAEYIHRHLDWRGPLDWIGQEPFLGIERHQNRLLAVLACPRDPTPIGWVRLFAYLDWHTSQMDMCWTQLLEALWAQVEPGQKYTLAALGLQAWFSNLLLNSGFNHRQNIVVLQWLGETRSARSLPPEVQLRPMFTADIPAVMAVDNRAFDPLWRHSMTELELAFHQAAYASVAELSGEIIGYQISTGSSYHAHLARLAVDPGLQRLSIGYALVWDMIDYFYRRGTPQISVNTQSDNLSSLALYEKVGFQRTGDEYPVFTYFVP